MIFWNIVFDKTLIFNLHLFCKIERWILLAIFFRRYWYTLNGSRCNIIKNCQRAGILKKISNFDFWNKFVVQKRNLTCEQILYFYISLYVRFSICFSIWAHHLSYLNTNNYHFYTGGEKNEKSLCAGHDVTCKLERDFILLSSENSSNEFLISYGIYSFDIRTIIWKRSRN